MKKLLLVALMVFTAATAQAEPAANGLLRVVLSSGPTSLDPYYELTEENIQMAHMVFDPLVRWGEDNGIEYRLAESLERKDSNTWRAHLKKDVVFHSGNPMTAKDIVWTFKRIKQSQDFKAIFDGIDSVSIIDDYTVDFHTPRPFGLVPNIMTYFYPMDSVFYSGTDSYGQDKSRVGNPSEYADPATAGTPANSYPFAHENTSGTGPFVITKNDPKLMELKSFDKYWGKRGNVNRLVITPITSESARVSALLSGNADFVMPVPPQDYVRLYGAPDVNFFAKGSSRIILLQMNMHGAPELQKKLVREAIIAATDNVGIVNKILSKSTIATDQFPTVDMPGHIAALKARYNLVRAKELLEEAGYKDKVFTLSMIATNDRYVADEKIAMTFAGMMQKIGVHVELKTMPRLDYWNEFRLRKADLAMIGWQPDTEDTANYFEYLLMCPDAKSGRGEYNFGEYCNPEIDRYVLAADSEQDMDKRGVLLSKAVQLAYDDAAFIPLHYEPHSWASSKRVTNAQVIVNRANSAYLGDTIIENLK